MLSDSLGPGVAPTEQHASTPNKDGVDAAASLAHAASTSDSKPQSATTAQYAREKYTPTTDEVIYIKSSSLGQLQQL